MNFDDLTIKLANNHFTSARIVQIGKKTEKKNEIHVDNTRPFMVKETLETLQGIVEGLGLEVRIGPQKEYFVIREKKL